MVEFLFQLVKVVRTNFAVHPFSQILKILSAIRTSIIAPPNDNFQICSVNWKGFFPRKIAVNLI